jgi:hypothetical protein
MSRSNVGLVIPLQLATLTIECILGYNIMYKHLLPNREFDLLFECILIGAIGGTLYCLHGVYFNYCVKKTWANEWIVWYLLRPVVSSVCGGVSYLFLKAGLLVLEAKKQSDATDLGFLALAFIAGLNVDKFLKKIEDLAKATWGIEKSKSDTERSKKFDN